MFGSQGPSEFLVVSVARWDELSRMLVKQEEECQELSKIITYMCERQEKLLAMERQKSLLTEAPAGRVPVRRQAQCMGEFLSEGMTREV